MLKLKLQYFGHLIWRTDSLEENLILGKTEGRRRWGQQRMRWLDRASLTQWTWVWVGSGSWWWAGKPGVLQSMGSQRIGHDWTTELNWKFFLIRIKSKVLITLTLSTLVVIKVSGSKIPLKTFHLFLTFHFFPPCVILSPRRSTLVLMKVGRIHVSW